MNCGRCTLPLVPGSAHVNEDACIEALLHARNCLECGELVEQIRHPSCAARAGVKAGAGLGAKKIEEKIVEGVMGWLNKKPADQPPEGEPPQKPNGGKRRWKP